MTTTLEVLGLTRLSWTPLFGVTQPIVVRRNEVLRDESDRAFPVYGDLS